MARPSVLLLTCEHGGRKIPAAYRDLFPPAVLETHRGWDIGALALARQLAKKTRGALLYSEISRLLVDLNRSVGKKGLFSEFTPASHDEILRVHYYPYRLTVESQIKTQIKAGFRVFHFSVHSFTPCLNGETRNCEIGLLYDPQRPIEKSVCSQISKDLKATEPELRTRLNYPYKGNADGFPTSLRKKYPAAHYCGIELEFNQGWLGTNKKGGFASRLSVIIVSAINSESRTRK